MRQTPIKLLHQFLVLSIAAFFILTGCAVTELKKISIDTLNNQMIATDVIIIDVRHGSSWQKSDMKIKGAVRENPLKVASWADKYQKDSNIVLYCA